MQMIVEIAQEELLITPDLGTPVSPRNTKRKTLIREVLNAEYGGGPVLLEELRWKVFLKETANDPNATEMTVSYQKSFTRTLRDHLPEIPFYKASRPDWEPVGLLVRAAIFRQTDRKLILSLFRSNDLMAYVRLNTDHTDTYWHQEPRIDQPEKRVFVICWLYLSVDQDRKNPTAKTNFPITSVLTLVGKTPDWTCITSLADKMPCLILRKWGLLLFRSNAHTSLRGPAKWNWAPAENKNRKNQ